MFNRQKSIKNSFVFTILFFSFLVSNALAQCNYYSTCITLTIPAGQSESGTWSFSEGSRWGSHANQCRWEFFSKPDFIDFKISKIEVERTESTYSYYIPYTIKVLSNASVGTYEFGVIFHFSMGDDFDRKIGFAIVVPYVSPTPTPTPTPTPSIPVPTDCQSFTYSSVTSPVLSADPSQAKPMGVGPVAEGGGTLNITIQINQFSGPVDIYFGLYLPEFDPDNIYLLTSSGAFQRLSDGFAPWKANITGPINESLFGDIPTSSLPKGTYYLYLLVTPTGNLSNYYLWITSFGS